MRAFISALTSAGIGFFAVIVIASIDATAHPEEKGMPSGDIDFWIFAALWIAEALSVMVIAMYRLTPIFAKLLGDDWEEVRLKPGARVWLPRLEIGSSIAISFRRAVIALDSGSFTSAFWFALAIAAVPVIIRIRTKKKNA
jgi:hypothetical protein